MPEKVTEKLIEAGKTISFMESCTSGLLASMFTDTEGASEVFSGSFVTYSNEAKVMQGVSRGVIEQFGVYSKECAREMAVAAQRAFNTDIAIGITGNTGNIDPKNPEGVTGEVFYCFIISGEAHDYHLKADVRKMTRKQIKQYYADAVYGSLYEEIKDKF